MSRGIKPGPLLATVLAIAVITPGVSADAFEASVRRLRATVNPQRDGSHVAMLMALRQLRDPSLRPLFYRLVQHDRWEIQSQAVVGLAEISDPPLIDPWLVTQVRPEAQEVIIAQSIDEGLIEIEQMRQLLESDQLEALSESLLLAELVTRGEPIERAHLDRLAAGGNIRIAGMTSCLLAPQDDGAAFEAFRARLDALPGRDRKRHTLWLLEVARQYRLTAATAWIQRVLGGQDVDPDIAYRGVLALLSLEPTTGLGQWRRFYGNDPSSRRQIRYGMLLLAADPRVPPKAFDALRSDDVLPQKMAAAGRALSAGTDPVAPLCELLDLGHMLTADWALDAVEKLDRESRVAIYLHLVDSIATAPAGQPERAALAARAAGQLFELAPDLFNERLAAAEDDGVTQRVLLVGLSAVDSPDVPAAVSQVRRIGSGRADSLTLILMARHRSTLERPDLRQLGLIAAGGGRVSDVFQVQAAWLYLKMTNRIETALGRLFSSN